MERATERPVGVLVIRAWREDEEPGSLRVLVRSSRDVEAEPEQVTAFADAADVVAFVRGWLIAVLTDSSS